MQMNQELLKQLSDQKYALDQAAIVAATDAHGIISYVNEKFCEVSGYGRDELVGNTHRIINSGHHPKSFFIDLWKTIAAGKVWRGEVCNRKKNGDYYWVYTTIVPFLDEKGKPIQYLSIRYDITELKSAQKIIMDQQEKLVAASRLSAIGEMAAAITHEINNPLGVILGRVEMLKSLIDEDRLDKKEIHHLAETIEVTGQRIAKIVKSMRTMAHHQDEEPTESVPLSLVLSDAKDLCLFRFQNKGIKLTVAEVSPQLYVECRSHQIVQVLVNLLNNSFDAISNLQDKWVKIEVNELANKVEIQVIDSGTGISKDIQNKMFNPFYSTKSVQYGTGLGLSISQGLLSKNSGELQYQTMNGHTCFKIILIRTQMRLS
jgi:PAS domain S-box-containing protein